MRVWKYCWESPDPAHWKSEFSFDSFERARDSAIWHARNARKRKYRMHIKPTSQQAKKVWKSMRSAGWRIRRKDVKNVE